MAKDQMLAINDAVLKIQFALLDGITDQKQLFAAGSLMSRSDYEDVVTERTIVNICGYPLCRKSLPSLPSRRGRYRISLKEHKVYDLQETSKFCSSDCLISSRAYSGTLQEARSSVLNPVKLNEILCLFLDSGAEETVGEDEDLELSKLRIHENDEPKVERVSLEEWMGPSNAIEGYVPMNNSNSKTSYCRSPDQDSKATQDKQEGFMSTVITNDAYSMSKLPSRANKATFGGGKLEKPKERGVAKSLERQATEHTSPPKKKESSSSSKSRSKKNLLFDEMDFVSTVITNDEYSVSKPPPHSTEIPLDGQPDDSKKQGSPIYFQQQNSIQGLSYAPRMEGSSKKLKESRKKVRFVEENKSMTQGVPQTFCEDGGKIQIVKASKGSPKGGTVLKSSLKPSGSKKLNHLVTWADESVDSGSCVSLCEVRNFDDTGPASGMLSLKEKDDRNNGSRFASAEACAMALSQAAEAVALGVSDVNGAVSEAGIILLPMPDQIDGEVSGKRVEEEVLESEPTLLKWPKKPGIPDSDIFDPNQSWFDDPPEGFTLTLSNFATMWNALFGWMTSSSLAYIYGKDESAHEEYLVVNGREYPRKIILGDGRSAEIKETLSGYLARALPGLAADLRLPIPISELEKGLGSILDTMSFTDAVPGLRVKQWQVIVLLFLEALSICRIPLLTPYISNRMLHNKVLEGGGIGVEQYETMKDMITPLGRSPHFSSQSGA